MACSYTNFQFQLFQLTEKYSSQNSRDYEHHNGINGTPPVPAKRFCEPSQSNGDISTTAPSVAVGHAINGRAPVLGAPGQVTNSRSLDRQVYPHSMPTSPTMFERGNEIRLVLLSLMLFLLSVIDHKVMIWGL